MLTLIGIVAALGAAIAGYSGSRSFVRRRLRFVDALQRPGVPLLAGTAAAAAALPVVWILPLVGGGTALLFGAGVGAGVAAGRRESGGERLLNG